VLGRSVVDVLVPGNLTREAGDVLDSVRRGKQWSGEFLVRHKDGRPLQVAAVDTAALDDEERVVAMVGESEDVWAERQLESELRATRDEQRLALAAGRLGILRWDRATGRVDLDETAEALLGLRPETFDGSFAT
jgi:PAS domain-containing protein